MAERPEIILTFDNLGEAAEEELGLRPPPPPHPSVAVALPRILGLLADLELTATFFVEAINVERYREALAEIAAAGHELGCHGWRHETWHALTGEEKRSVLRRCGDAFASLGCEAAGFRPPGGVIDDGDARLLVDHGIMWTSPAGDRAGIEDGLVFAPFDWTTIDAYFFAEQLAPLRQANGLSPALLDHVAFVRATRDAIASALATGEPLCLVLHPFLYDRPGRWEALSALLAELRQLRSSGRAHVGPGAEAAARLRADASMHTGPRFDQATWSTTGDSR